MAALVQFLRPGVYYETVACCENCYFDLGFGLVA